MSTATAARPYVSLVSLQRTATSDGASVGLISLPLPRDVSGDLRLDHPTSDMHPLAWWSPESKPRRALAMVLADPAASLPRQIKLTTGPAPTSDQSAGPWSVVSRITRQKLEFTPRPFTNIASLRGVPYEETTYIESEVLLTFGQRTLSLQFGATGPDGDLNKMPFVWQNVQVDALWSNRVAQAVRLGGVIYNGDTYLWADVFLLLFANGVAQVSAHFVVTKLHIEGYDFQGLPAIRMSGDGVSSAPRRWPADGPRFDAGWLRLNVEDACTLCNDTEPGLLRQRDGVLEWTPFTRTRNPQLPAAPPIEWAPGFARTVRWEMSFSDAAPVIARYHAPEWWYSLAGEPWSGEYLPVDGRLTVMPDAASVDVRKSMVRGQFDHGSAGIANDGFAGVGLLRNAIRTGDEAIYRDAMDHFYYWADIAVDHRDFSIHQWLGGWQWKTCAYSKFRDLLFGYMETADPYMRDAVENCADAYWMWFRSNWPRNTVGRDAFEVAGWAMLWRYLGGDHARNRTHELIRMMKTVVDTRGVIGGQMGSGPHPGFHSSLYMAGVALLSVLEAFEANRETDRDPEFAALLTDLAGKLYRHYIRHDVELFPSNLRPGQPNIDEWTNGSWIVSASRICAQGARLGLLDPEAAGLYLRRLADPRVDPLTDLAASNRRGDNLNNPPYHDAMMLGARLADEGVELSPLVEPELWPAEQAVSTPWGPLRVSVTRAGARTGGTEPNDGGSAIRFAAEQDFAVTLHLAGRAYTTRSRSAINVADGAINAAVV